jgi:beta-aspartyl-peptidase (threonine type)
MLYGIAVHGGAGSTEALKDGLQRACERGFSILKNNGDAISAVVEAVKVLEDDGRFNAGAGSVLRIDGKTIEMDASLMSSDGRLAMVMAVRDIKNPVLLAKALLKTPHLAMAGNGATVFAKRLGLPLHPGPSEKALELHKRVMDFLQKNKAHELNPLWKELPQELLSDTVGAVALDRNGIFAVASSTGGAIPMLCGRVGDTPLIGCGFYAGSLGAIAVTGIGEEIIKRLLALRIYKLIEEDKTVKEAFQEAIKLFSDEIPVGMIGITKEEIYGISNREMAWASITDKGP